MPGKLPYIFRTTGRPVNKIDISVDLRWSGFEQIGPYTIYQTDANGNKTDSTISIQGQNVKTYGGPEPRFTIRYPLNDQTSLKGSVSQKSSIYTPGQ